GNTLLSTMQVQSLATTFSLSLPPGVHSLQAIYNGDGDSLSTVSPLLRHVIPLPTTLTLTASSDTSLTNETFSLTATVTPFPNPLMQILAFFQDNQRVGQVLLEADGSAHFSIDHLSPGPHQFTATFPGSEFLAPSSSNEIV